MKKTLVTAPLSEADLLNFVKSSSDDFEFEMDIVYACQRFCETQHGGHYQDPETGKNRQFDIRAVYKNSGRILKMAIECKNLQLNHPLLVSRVPRAVEESYHSIVFSSPFQSENPDAKYSVGITRLDGSSPFFPPNQPVGKAMAHVSKSEVEDGKGGNYPEYSARDTEVYTSDVSCT